MRGSGADDVDASEGEGAEPLARSDVTPELSRSGKLRDSRGRSGSDIVGSLFVSPGTSRTSSSMTAFLSIASRLVPSSEPRCQRPAASTCLLSRFEKQTRPADSGYKKHLRCRYCEVASPACREAGHGLPDHGADAGVRLRTACPSWLSVHPWGLRLHRPPPSGWLDSLLDSRPACRPGPVSGCAGSSVPQARDTSNPVHP